MPRRSSASRARREAGEGRRVTPPTLPDAPPRPPAATGARAGVASSATARGYGRRDGRREEAGPLAVGGEAVRRERERRGEREWPGWQSRHKTAATS